MAARSSPTLHQATYIDLPPSLTQHCHGLAMDFGGSVVKIAYRPKDKNPRQGEPQVPEGRERIRLVAYSRDDLDRALAEVEQLVDIRRSCDDDMSAILTTGVGSHQYADKIRQTFRVKSTNVTETDCFVNCFKEVSKHLPKSEILDPPDAEAEKWAQGKIDMILGVMDKFAKHTESDMTINTDGLKAREKVDNKEAGTLPYAEENKALFPCILVMLGSAFGVIKITQDGTFQMIDVSNRGGRTFLGLGSLLTGAKTFDELIGLAEQGSDKAVSVYTNDLVDTTQDDIYAHMPDDFLLFCFGKAVGKKIEDFKREDIARALVANFVTDLGYLVHSSLGITNIPNIFFCGNFSNADIIRHELTKCLTMRRLSAEIKTQFSFHFLKHGGFLGAIGAFIQKPKPAEPEV